MFSRGNSNSFSRAQGTVEYLVIIAVVVVLSLVVVGVVITQTESGANVSSTASEISSKSGLLAISNVSLNALDGNFFVSLKNNDAESITVTSMRVTNDLNIFSEQLNMTSERVFKVATMNSCTLGQKSSATVTVGYTTKYGLSKSQVFSNVLVNCEAISVDASKLAGYVGSVPVVGLSDVTPPTILLSSPDDNNVVDYFDHNVLFVFSADENVVDCNLYIGNVLVDRNSSLVVANGLVFLDGNVAAFGEGDHFWDVNCLDTNNNLGSAVDRNINYTAPYVSVFRSVYFSSNSDFNAGSYFSYATRFGSIKNFGQLDWNINDGTNRIDGLIAHWKLNDSAASTTVVDSVNGQDGNSIVNTSGLHTTAKLGTGAFIFNGLSDKVIIPKNYLPMGATNRTITMWIKIPVGGRYTLLFYGNPSTAQQMSLEAGYPNNNELYWEEYGTGYGPTTSGANIADGAWHFVAYRYDDSGVGTSTIWVDTVQKGSGTGHINTVDRADLNATLGVRYNTQYYFKGSMDDVRIYNKALTTDEMAVLYNSTNGTEQNGRGNWTDANLVAYYKFDNKDGNKVFDSARGNTGTLTNGADTNAKGLWDTNAGYFDNVNDYVSIANESSFDIDITTPVSISAWIYWTGSGNVDDIIFSKHMFPSPYTGYSFGVFYYFPVPNGKNYLLFNAMSAGQDSYTYGSTAIPQFQWSYVVVTYDGSRSFEGVKLYLNGKEEVKRTVLTFPTASWLNDISPNIGGRGNSGWYFQGSIDEVKIYKRVLTLADVQADYNRGLFDSNYVSRIIDTNLGTINPVGTDFNYLVLNSNNGLDKNGHIYGAQIEPSIEKDLNNGLVGLWHLNESVGANTFVDSSATGMNVSCSACPTQATARFGNGSFFSNSNKLNLPTSNYPIFTNLSKVTVGTWVKTTANNSIILGLQNSAGLIYFLTGNFYVGGYLGKATVWFRNNENTTMVLLHSTMDINDGQWHYLSLSWNGQTAFWYVDGVLADSAAISGTVSFITANSNLGGDYGGSNIANCTLDDFAIWSRALDANSVKELFNKGASRIGVKYRGCESDVSCTQSWSSMIYPSSSNQVSLDSLDGNRYLQYALYPTLYQFPDGNYFPQAFATIRDVNLVYTN